MTDRRMDSHMPEVSNSPEEEDPPRLEETPALTSDPEVNDNRVAFGGVLLECGMLDDDDVCGDAADIALARIFGGCESVAT